jgi:hypothetical protein
LRERDSKGQQRHHPARPDFVEADTLDTVDHQVVDDPEVDEALDEVLQVVPPQRSRGSGGVYEGLDDLAEGMRLLVAQVGLPGTLGRIR